MGKVPWTETFAGLELPELISVTECGRLGSGGSSGPLRGDVGNSFGNESSTEALDRGTTAWGGVVGVRFLGSIDG